MPWFWPIGRPNTCARWRTPAALQGHATETDGLGGNQDPLGIQPVQDVVKPLPSSPMRSATGMCRPSMNT